MLISGVNLFFQTTGAQAAGLKVRHLHDSKQFFNYWFRVSTPSLWRDTMVILCGGEEQIPLITPLMQHQNDFVFCFSGVQDSSCFDSLVANTVVLIMHRGVYN